MNRAEAVLEVLKKKKYSRDLPRDEAGVLRIVSKAVSLGEPIKAVGFWGIGPKVEPNWADHKTARFLGQLNEECRKEHAPGIAYEFVIADNYGEFNGISESSRATYVRAMQELFVHYGMRSTLLSSLWQKHGINRAQVYAYLKAQSSGWWEGVPHRQMLEEQAKKRHAGDHVAGAKAYYAMRVLENPAIEQEYAGSVLFVFTDRTDEHLLPALPTVYLHAWKGSKAAPWFVTAI